MQSAGKRQTVYSRLWIHVLFLTLFCVTAAAVTGNSLLVLAIGWFYAAPYRGSANQKGTWVKNSEFEYLSQG